MYKVFKRVTAVALLLSATLSFAGGGYLVCGSDEDGCDLNHPDIGCMCFPYDQINANRTHCLHFGAKLTCKPLKAGATQCPAGDFSAPSQASCLALAYQSEANPPCSHFLDKQHQQVITANYCQSHHIPIENADGSVSG
ncbi:MAG: hypothetical protein P1U63_13360 [Coxiellaceae bacterium]|nr:hypothetical protein [Coxiellaceae bacterium]